jgi:hypothetical protein
MGLTSETEATQETQEAVEPKQLLVQVVWTYGDGSVADHTYEAQRTYIHDGKLFIDYPFGGTRSFDLSEVLLVKTVPQ